MKEIGLDIERFIKDYPGMSIAPSRDSAMVINGVFSFTARPNGGAEISDSYHLHIVFPATFPGEIPKVTETGQKIPRDGNYHVNGDDDTLCLGSPIHLLKLISEEPTFVGFAERCLMPYLYAISLKLRNNAKLPFGELTHGVQGIIDDYMELFGLKNTEQVLKTLEMLGKKKRTANRSQCPCGCGHRLGRCKFSKKLGKYRHMTNRLWFREHARKIKAKLAGRINL